MKKFLNEDQIKTLTKVNNWTNIKPAGAFLNLYPEDFVADIESWNQVCDQLQIPYDSKSATILYFAVNND
jgi:hypothetical protein